MGKPAIFILCLLAFVFGAFFGAIFPLALHFSFFAASACACPLASSILFFWLTKPIQPMPAKIALLAVCFAITGLVRAEFAHKTSAYISLYKQKTLFYARVVSDPKLSAPQSSSKSPNKKPRLSFQTLPQGYKQKILVYTSGSKKISYGDFIFLRGKPSAAKNFAGFNYIQYLAAKNIYAQMYFPEIFSLRPGGNFAISKALAFKHLVVFDLRKNLSPAQSGLEIAILTGDKSFMEQSDTNAFNGTGLAHMIAVSGYKLTIVLIWLEIVILPFGRRKAAFASAVFSFLYLAISGFAPAVLRAAIMSLVFVYSRFAGKKFNLLTALALAAAILVAVNPLITAYDIGFQLSFLGIAGIIVFGPWVRKALAAAASKINFLRAAFSADALGIKEIFITGISAQAATFPLIIYYFHQFSPFAPLLNVLAVPLLPFAIMGGYLSAVPAAGKIFSWALAPLLQYLLLLARAFYFY